MRRLLLSFVCLPALLLADEASKRTKIDQLMVLMDSEALSRQMMDQAHHNVQAEVMRPGTPAELQPILKEYADKMVAVVDRQLRWTVMRPKVAQFYAESFTEPELDSILTFYRSPAGKALVQKMPTLMNKSMELGQQQLQSARPEIQKLSDEMITKMKAKAAASHPATAPPPKP